MILSIALFIGMAKATGILPPPENVFCEQHNGVVETLTLKDQARRTTACCIDGGCMESIALYDEVRGVQKTLAAQHFLQPVIFHPPSYGNPAAHYCLHLGGQNEIYLGQGGESGYCRFSDGSMINQWTLFGGAQSYPALADLVQP